MIGVIGGSGLYELLEGARHEEVPTPYGEPSSPLSLGTVAGQDVAFITRHGTKHSIPPHKINYRANLWALHHLGARQVITSSAVGSLKAELTPGTFVLCDQFVDRTWGRADTFFDGPQVAHVSVADPYCPRLRCLATQVMTSRAEQFVDHGTAVVIQGPRFSTRAESQWFQAMGWDVLSMTQHPETALARELAMCCVNVAFVTDADAGVSGAHGPDAEPVTAGVVWRRLRDAQPRITGAIFDLIAAMASPAGSATPRQSDASQAVDTPNPAATCTCAQALADL